MDKEAIETVKIVAEATGKVAELGTKSLETGEKFGGFLTKFLGVQDLELLGTIKDKLQFFRWERQCRMANKYNEIYSNQNMQPIPPKFLIPILENASMEDDDSLQDLWINLLGAWTNADYKEERRLAFVDIIKALTPTDAMILKKIYEYEKQGERPLDEKYKNKFFPISKDRIFENMQDKEYYLSVDNLKRIGCISNSITWGALKGEHISITHLGIKFLEACIGDNKI